MKLIHINVWRKCMKCPQGKYILALPSWVEKINAIGEDFPKAHKYGITGFPTWVIVNDNNEVVAKSMEIDINKAVEWYKGVQANA